MTARMLASTANPAANQRNLSTVPSKPNTKTERMPSSRPASKPASNLFPYYASIENGCKDTAHVHAERQMKKLGVLRGLCGAKVPIFVVHSRMAASLPSNRNVAWRTIWSGTFSQS